MVNGLWMKVYILRQRTVSTSLFLKMKTYYSHDSSQTEKMLVNAMIHSILIYNLSLGFYWSHDLCHIISESLSDVEFQN